MSIKHNVTNHKRFGTSRMRAEHVGGVRVIKPNNRSYASISKAVTPREFRRAFKSAMTGDPARLFEILEFFMTIDDEIPAAMQSLKSAILGDGIQIKPMEDSGQEGQTQADVLHKVFDDLDFEELCEELLDSHFFGFSKPINFTEESWQTVTIEGRQYQVPVTYEALARDWIYAKKESRDQEYTTLYVGDQPLYEYPEGSVVLKMDGKLPTREDINFTRFGVGLGCIRYATFKYYDYEDWAAMLETFATPMILGKVGTGGKEEVVKRAVNEMANDARGVIGETDSIEFPQANSTMSGDAYDKFAQHANRAISNKIKSESLTDNLHGGGSYAAARTANGIRVDVASSIARKLLRVVKRKIVQPIAELNWNGRMLADLHFPVQAVEDDMATARKYTEANKIVSLSKKQVREDLNLREAEDDDDTIPVKRGIGFGGV